jgi:hypothetical protein
MSQKGIKVTIRNWESYNLRKDVKSCSWFRMSHNLFEDSDFFEFTHTERCVWLYLLCQASQKNSNQVIINPLHLVRIGQFKMSEFSQALIKLESIQCITVNGTASSRERTATDRQTDRQTDTHFDFSQAYQSYPRKMGKSEGIKRLNKEIRTEAEVQLLLQAVDRFKAHHEKEGTQKKFIPYFSTFVSHWRDWLDPDIGKTQQELKPVQSVEEILEEDRKRKLKIEEDLRGVGKL